MSTSSRHNRDKKKWNSHRTLPTDKVEGQNCHYYNFSVSLVFGLFGHFYGMCHIFPVPAHFLKRYACNFILSHFQVLEHSLFHPFSCFFVCVCALHQSTRYLLGVLMPCFASHTQLCVFYDLEHQQQFSYALH